MRRTVHASICLARLAKADALWDSNRAILFVHVPKTGGTAIEQALINAIYNDNGVASASRLRRSLLAKHLLNDCEAARSDTMGWHRAGIPHAARQIHMSDARARVILRRCYNETRRVTSFALVRNPIEVRLSAWLWLRKYGARSLRHLGFEEFITTGSFADPRRAGLLALPQSTWLGPHTKLFPYQCDGSASPLLDFIRRHYPSISSLPRSNMLAPGDAFDGSILSNMSVHAKRSVLQAFGSDFELWRSVKLGKSRLSREGERRLPQDQGALETATLQLCSSRWWRTYLAERKVGLAPG